MNHLVSPYHDLDYVSATRTTNGDTPAKSKISDLLVIESEVIDAVGAVEERDTFGLGRIHWSPGEEERGRTGKAIITEVGLKPGYR